MITSFSYVRHSLALFSPETGLDEATAAKLMEHQLQAAAWRDGLATELDTMLKDETTDWMSVIDNEAFCMGEFETPREAREFVVRLLGPFVSKLGRPNLG